MHPIVVAAFLAGCAGTPAPTQVPPQTPVAADDGAATAAPRRPAGGRRQLSYALPAGRHDCELGQHVSLRRDPRDANRIDLEWQGERYVMTRLASSSGLPRYEHHASRLVWIELPWKGMLLDARSGRPLANECKPA